MKYTYHKTVSATMCDINGNLSILGCVQEIQDASCYMLGLVGSDNVSLKKNYDAMWVFTKNKIKFLKTLKWNDEFKVESFISSHSKITAIVDTVFKNKDDEIIIYARLEICPIDLTTHRIRKVDTVGITSDVQLEDSIMGYNFEDLNKDYSQIVSEIKVPSTSIDFSHHTNNTEYIRHILNTYESVELEKMNVKECEIHYTKESREKEKLSIYKLQENNTDYFQIMRENEIICKVKIVK